MCGARKSSTKRRTEKKPPPKNFVDYIVLITSEDRRWWINFAHSTAQPSTMELRFVACQKKRVFAAGLNDWLHCSGCFSLSHCVCLDSKWLWVRGNASQFRRRSAILISGCFVFFGRRGCPPFFTTQYTLTLALLAVSLSLFFTWHSIQSHVLRIQPYWRIAYKWNEKYYSSFLLLLLDLPAFPANTHFHTRTVSVSLFHTLYCFLLLISVQVF